MLAINLRAIAVGQKAACKCLETSHSLCFGVMESLHFLLAVLVDMKLIFTRRRDSNPQFPDPKSDTLSIRPSGLTLKHRLTSGMVCKDGTLGSHLASTVVSFSKY